MTPEKLELLNLEHVCFHNIDGYWTEMRVDRKSVPENWSRYECRDDGCSGDPCTIEYNVWVNYWGTFIVPKGTIDLEKEEGKAIYIDLDDENDTINFYDDGIYRIIDGKVVKVDMDKFIHDGLPYTEI